MSDDAAHVLFPSDAPKPNAVPDWRQVQHSAAEARLAGSQRRDGASSQQPPAQDEKPDVAAQLFAEDAKSFDDGVVTELFDPLTLGAISDGDQERADALKAATSALTENFRAAGTDSTELKAAFDIFREANDLVVPPTPERIAEDMAQSLSTLQAELGPSFQSSLNAARAFIRDLEIVAPGTIASLEHNGAGNDLRLVRAAIKEARRRGY
jgi:hypothetical protein